MSRSSNLLRALLIAVSTVAGLSADAHDPVIHTSREAGRPLPLPKGDDMFHFVIYGDRTGGKPEGIKVLEQAVVDTNLLAPDLVMTVGDLVQGYNEPPEWMEQMQEFRGVMARLEMPWFPVAGNHDIFWRTDEDGAQPPPQEHEDNYEKHFGPLWYWFQHKNTGFLVLYTEEGPSPKNFSKPENVTMSQTQLDWLSTSLGEMKDLDNVFVFLHHPRWIKGRYEGNNWDKVHEQLVTAGNVRGVFAGHIHRLHYDGVKDGIGYYALATTGGVIPGEYPEVGYVHHMNLVTVRKSDFSVAVLPVGTVMDPTKYTPKRLEEMDAARRMPFELVSSPMEVQETGRAVGAYRLEAKNPAKVPLEVTVTPEQSGAGWLILPDHLHFKIQPGATAEVALTYAFSGDSADLTKLPVLSIATDFLDGDARIPLPPRQIKMELALAQVSDDFFAGDDSRVLDLAGGDSALRVQSSSFELPDGAFTLECWANPTKEIENGALLAKTQMSEFAIFVREGSPRFEVFLDGSYKVAETTEKLPIGKWSHVAGVFDGKEVRMYLDGKLVGAAPASGHRETNNLPFYVGADPDGRGDATRGFIGQIDNVRLSSGNRYEGESFDPPSADWVPDESTVLIFDCDKAVNIFVPGRGAKGSVSGTLTGKAALRDGSAK